MLISTLKIQYSLMARLVRLIFSTALPKTYSIDPKNYAYTTATEVSKAKVISNKLA